MDSSLSIVTRRTDDARNTKKIHKANLHQKTTLREDFKARRKDDLANGIRKVRIVNRRQVGQGRDRWRTATREVFILVG